MNKLTIAILFFANCSSSFAMQAMDDESLTSVTAQDGLNIGIKLPQSTLSFDQFRVVDTDGIEGTTANGAASLVIAPTYYSKNTGIRFLNQSGGAANAPLSIKVDAGSNSSQAVANIGILLPSDLRRINISPMSIFLAAGNTSIYGNVNQSRAINTNGTIRTSGGSVHKILEIGNHGLDIVFTAQPVAVNVQLGGEAQGHMFQVASGAITCIANANLCDSNTLSSSDPIQVFSSGGSSMKFDFKLSANNQTTGFRLGAFSGFSGFYGDITQDGLEIGSTGITDKLNINLSNITMGNAGSTDPNQLNGLKNGPMGNVGFNGISVKDLKMTISGL